MRLPAALSVALLLFGCGGPAPVDTLAGLTLVAGTTPFGPGCEGAPQSGRNYPGAQVEPFVAADPADPAHLHLIGVWQQDRFSNGGSKGNATAASFDGGKSWTRSLAPFSRCGGGTVSNGGDYDRATDPWVTFSPDGTAYQCSVSFDDAQGRAVSAVLVSRSSDGGRSWGAAVAVQRDDNPDVFNDKESITADPKDSGAVYVVWDRLTGQTNADPALGSGPAMLARLLNGSWQKAQILYDPGMDAQTIANQIVVMPDGTLVDLFVVITQESSRNPSQRIAVARSTDKGATWSGPIVVGELLPVGVEDPRTRTPVRSGAVVPAIAVDPVGGKLYAAWEDARFSNGLRDGIALSVSADGGLSWSAPVQVDQDGAAAFTPALAVTRGGKLGLTYYEVEPDFSGDPGALVVGARLATSLDGGETFTRVALGGAFSLRRALSGTSYFVGDYQGLAAGGEEFLPFFVRANSGQSPDATDVYFKVP